MEDLENPDDDIVSDEFVSSVLMQNPEDLNHDCLTNRVDKAENDGVDLQSLLADTDELGYEPPDRSQNNRMMAAILDGVVPEDTVDPGDGFVENPNVSFFIGVYLLSRLHFVPNLPH